MYIYKTTNVFEFCKPCEGYNLLVGSGNCTIWYQTIYTFQNLRRPEKKNENLQRHMLEL